MSKYTPGPWEVIEAEDGGSFTIQNPTPDHDSGSLMYDPIVWEMGGIDIEANAHLIAAAPDLLAELQEIVAGWKLIEEGYMRGRKLTDWEKERLQFARAAIAKARTS